MADLSTFFIFAIFSCLLWVLAGGIVFRALLRRFGFRTGLPWRGLSRVGKGFRFTIAILCGAYTLAVGWSFIEPYYPLVETVTLTSPKVNEPLRIVHISDTHCDPVMRAEDRVIEKVRKLHPDLILFTGDGVNSKGGIPRFKKLMGQLSGVAPLYGVQGNWEAWWFRDVDTFADTGMTELNNKAISVRVRNQRIWLIGAPVDGEAGLRRRARKLPRSAFRIGLHHFPAALTRLDGTVDLLLSGDTHGGQIFLPVLGPLIKIRRWRTPFYTAGLHTTAAGTHLYVNRGIGMEGRRVPRVRFNVPPEITLIEIHPGNGTPTNVDVGQ